MNPIIQQLVEAAEEEAFGLDGYVEDAVRAETLLDRLVELGFTTENPKKSDGTAQKKWVFTIPMKTEGNKKLRITLTLYVVTLRQESLWDVFINLYYSDVLVNPRLKTTSPCHSWSVFKFDTTRIHPQDPIIVRLYQEIKTLATRIPELEKFTRDQETFHRKLADLIAPLHL